MLHSLILENSPMSSYIIKSLLEHKGCDVEVASNIHSGMALALSRHFDFIITNTYIEEENDGLIVAKVIHRTHLNQNTPIYGYSIDYNFDHYETWKEWAINSMEAGIQDLYLKLLDSDSIDKIIHDVKHSYLKIC